MKLDVAEPRVDDGVVRFRVADWKPRLGSRRRGSVLNDVGGSAATRADGGGRDRHEPANRQGWRGTRRRRYATTRRRPRVSSASAAHSATAVDAPNAPAPIPWPVMGLKYSRKPERVTSAAVRSTRCAASSSRPASSRPRRMNQLEKSQV